MCDISWYRLNPKDLGLVIKELERIYPKCLVQKHKSNEVEVNVDLLTGAAFHKVDAFVDTLVQ